MIAKEVFDKISGYIEQAERTQKSSPLLDQVRALNLEMVGEANYMNLKCSYQAQDGSSIAFEFRSYDPSGPFQNLPDVNKIKLQLLKENSVVSEVSTRFDDASVYG
jgi:hypothetical protein